MLTEDIRFVNHAELMQGVFESQNHPSLLNVLYDSTNTNLNMQNSCKMSLNSNF